MTRRPGRGDKDPEIVHGLASPLQALYTARFKRQFNVGMAKEYIDLLTPAGLRTIQRYVERRLKKVSA